MVTSGYRPHTTWHGCRPSMGIFNFFISYWTSTGPVRDPQGCRTAHLRTRKGIAATRICKNPTRASHEAVRDPYGPLVVPARVVHGLFTIFKPVRARKLIMHALKLYGTRTGRQNSYGVARVPCGSREWTYAFSSKQPRSSPYGVRAGEVNGALVKGERECKYSSFPSTVPPT